VRVGHSQTFRHFFKPILKPALYHQCYFHGEHFLPLNNNTRINYTSACLAVSHDSISMQHFFLLVQHFQINHNRKVGPTIKCVKAANYSAVNR